MMKLSLHVPCAHFGCGTRGVTAPGGGARATHRPLAYFRPEPLNLMAVIIAPHPRTRTVGSQNGPRLSGHVLLSPHLGPNAILSHPDGNAIPHSCSLALSRQII